MFRVVLLSAVLGLSGCGAAKLTAKAGWAVTKGTAKVAYKGTKAGVNLARGRKMDGTARGYDGNGRGADVACQPDEIC